MGIWTFTFKETYAMHILTYRSYFLMQLCARDGKEQKCNVVDILRSLKRNIISITMPFLFSSLPLGQNPWEMLLTFSTIYCSMKPPFYWYVYLFYLLKYMLGIKFWIILHLFDTYWHSQLDNQMNAFYEFVWNRCLANLGMKTVTCSSIKISWEPWVALDLLNPTLFSSNVSCWDEDVRIN